METKDNFEMGTWELSNCLKSEHRYVIRLVRKYLSSFEYFGDVAFIRRKSLNGRPVDEFRLNSPQTLLLCSLMPNTKYVLNFKVKIIDNVFNPGLLSVSDELKHVDKTRHGYVYIIQKKELVKIGASVNPNSRIKCIASHYSEKIDNQYISLPMRDHYKMELKLHTHFYTKRKYGEWFLVDFKEVVNYLKEEMVKIKPKKFILKNKNNQ